MKKRLLASIFFACRVCGLAHAAISPFLDYPAVFSWSGGSSLATGTFTVFDVEHGVDTSTVFYGGKTAANVPGWGAGVFRDFCAVFHDTVSGGLPLGRDSGYALRLPSSVAGRALELADMPVLGGLLVESGAAGYSFGGSVKASDTLRFGVASSASTNRIEIGEDFTINRTSAVEFSGRSCVNVASGHTLRIDGVRQYAVRGARKALPYLSLSGEGSFACNGLAIPDGATLDLSALPRESSGKPFIGGMLDLAAAARLVLPSGLAADTAYPICGGQLVMEDGLRAVAFGDGEFGLVQLSGDAVNGKLSWSEATVDARTLEAAAVSWSSLSGLTTGRPLVLTLTCDVRLTMDTPGVELPALLVLGDHRLSIAMQNTADFGDVFVGRSAQCEQLYYYHSADDKSVGFGGELTLKGGKAYDTVIEGPATGEAASWSGAISVEGSLVLSGKLSFTSGAFLVDGNGSVKLSEDAQVLLGSAACSVAGRLEVPAGASLKFAADNLLSSYGGSLALVIGGTLDFGDTCQTLADGGVMELYRGSLVKMDAMRTQPGAALTVDSPTGIHVYGEGSGESAQLQISLGCTTDSSLLVEDSAKLVVEGVTQYGTGVFDPSGAGSIELPSGSSMPFTNDLFCVGGLTGAGTARFRSNPSKSMLAASLKAATWTGECQLYQAEFTDFDPVACGNAGSTLGFHESRGSFANDADLMTTVHLYGESTNAVPALCVNDGADGSQVRFLKLSGQGRLSVGPAASGSARHRVQVAHSDDYTGTFEVLSGAAGAIVLTEAAAGREPVAADDDGLLVVRSGTWEIVTNTAWQSAAGIRVDSPATVVNKGELKSAVIGTGTVSYEGDLPSTRPESAARFFDGAWHGTVAVLNSELDDRDLYNLGNANSKIMLSGVYGSLAAQTCTATLVVGGGGLKLTSATASKEVAFGGLGGAGSLVIETGSDSNGSTFSFRQVDDFSGPLTLNSAYTSILFGENATRSADATLVFGDGVRIHANAGWSVPHVDFGSSLTAIGMIDGDYVVRSRSDEELYLDSVKVSLEASPGTDPRQCCGLQFNSTTKQVSLVKTETPPDMDIGDVEIKYGLDFTNVAIRVSVTNYWAGYKFNGKTIARVLISDASGRLVGARECLIDGDGDYYVGGADLPYGPGSDYQFNVEIYTEQRDTGENTERSSTLVSASAVRAASGWFYEDVASFSASAPSPLKSGTWSYGEGTITTNDEDELLIDTGVRKDPFVNFQPDNAVSSDNVRIHFGDAVFTALQDFGTEAGGGYYDIGGGIAAVTLACDCNGTEPVPYFAVWVCGETESTSGRFVRVSGPVTPESGVKYSVDCVINRRDQTISYLINDCALTNSEGLAFFPLPDYAVRNDYSLRFRGKGRLADVAGEQRNANVAGVVNGNVTSEYASVDAAVAAATNAGDRVELLWDASWRPLAEDVGRTVPVNCGEYTLHIDAAATNQLAGGGYRFIDNRDGTYTIGVIEYELQFQPNDASGTMAPQKFSVTNLVFNLVSNAFQRTGSEFDCWNEKENGRGLHSWADGGLIDMSEFGLTNKQLYAQWKVAVNTIVIEPADEYVYIDSVTTNGQQVAGVKYFGHSDSVERAKGRGSAQIAVEYGSTLVVRFSTDIGKLLTTPDWQLDPGYRQYSNISNSFRVANIGENLPRYQESSLHAEAPTPLSEVESWAIIHGIPLQAAASSPFAVASAKLNMNSLLTEDSEVVISDFRLNGNRCTFTVTIDGEPLANASLIKSMIQVTGNLAGEWHQVDESRVSVDGEGRVTVLTDADSSFVKIVIQ